MTVSQRTILLTNDDGYTSPGIIAAYQAIRHLGHVHVVAPSSERSACSHTITQKGPIIVKRITHQPFGQIFAVDGTPADCVRVALTELITESVDLVVSGINHGANAGVDTFYSGTVAAAREAAIMGVKGIAISQALRKDLDTDWSVTASTAAIVMDTIMDESLPAPGFWSINLPAPIPDNPKEHIHRVPTSIAAAPMSFDRHTKDEGQTFELTYCGNYWVREDEEKTDYTVVRNGGITVTPIPLRAV